MSAFEIRGTFKSDPNEVVLRTDERQRAVMFAKALHGNGHYSQVFVIIGSQRYSYSEFISQLENAQ